MVSREFNFLILSVLVVCLLSCQKKDNSPKGILYAINSGPNGNDGSIVRFAGANTVTGDTSPSGVISGVATTLVCPYYAYLDINANRMYVADPCSSAVAIFDSVSTLTGNVAPSRRVTGGLTTFAAAGLTSMMAVAVDTTKDILYVSTSNAAGTVAEIAVFDNASTVNGNVAPDRVITTPANSGSMLYYNHGITIDSENDRIFVASPGDSSVLSFKPASTANGSHAPYQSISGASTGLSGTFPAGVKLDANGNLLVSCRTPLATPTDGGIIVYAFINLLSTGSLNISPGRLPITGGNTTFAGPYMMDYDASVPELYVANAYGNSVLVFSDFDSTVADMTPARSLSGASTGLSAPSGTRTVTGVLIDTTR